MSVWKADLSIRLHVTGGPGKMSPSFHPACPHLQAISVKSCLFRRMLSAFLDAFDPARSQSGVWWAVTALALALVSLVSFKRDQSCPFCSWTRTLERYFVTRSLHLWWDYSGVFDWKCRHERHKSLPSLLLSSLLSSLPLGAAERTCCPDELNVPH